MTVCRIAVCIIEINMLITTSKYIAVSAVWSGILADMQESGVAENASPCPRILYEDYIYEQTATPDTNWFRHRRT